MSEDEVLLDAATAVLARDPGASMQEVARAAGVGRATLYRRHPSREDLLRAIRLRALGECTAALAEVPAGGGPWERLAESVRALMAVVDRYRVLANAPRLDRSDPEQRSLADRIEAPLAGIVEEGVARGEFRLAVPVPVAAAMIVALLPAARRGVVEAGVDPAEAESAVLDGVAGIVGRRPR